MRRFVRILGALPFAALLWFVPALLLSEIAGLSVLLPRERLVGAELVARCGAPGRAAGELSQPKGLAASADGRVFAADTGNERVQVFDPAGRFVAAWGGPEKGPWRGRAPVDVHVSGDGRVWVLDRFGRVTGHDPSGRIVETHDGELPDATGLSVEGAGRFLLAGQGGIYRFAPPKPLDPVVPLSETPADILDGPAGGPLLLFARDLRRPSEDGALETVWGIPPWLPVPWMTRLAREGGRTYVAGGDSHRILVFSAGMRLEGSVLRASEVWFQTLTGICGVGDGTLWVADAATSELIRLRPDPRSPSDRGGRKP